MSHHIEDGRVWAVDKRTGEKRRVKPHILKFSKNLSLAPSERTRGKAVRKLTEPKRRRKKKTEQVVTEPAAPSSEPDNSTTPVTEPEPTENKEH